MEEENKITEKQCDINRIIERLEKLQKWHPWAGGRGGEPGIDWEKDNDGDWIQVEDITALIKELKGS